MSEIPVPHRIRETMGVAKTNGPRRQPETVLAAPIRHNEQEDHPAW